MKIKKSPQNNKKGAPLWMSTFSDLVTLILVFFILLFSMSQLDLKKFQEIAESFKQRNVLDFYPSSIPLDYPSSSDDLMDEKGKQKGSGNRDGNSNDQLDELLLKINQYIKDFKLDHVIVATRNERGIVLVLPEHILFNTGEAVLLESSFPFLNQVGELLKDIPNLVKVEGHTDSRPINTVKYPSNWNLSSARASSVIMYLIDEFGIEPERFVAIGYAETRPIAPNDGPENWQKNRRVEIIISEETDIP